MTFNEGVWDRVIRTLVGIALGYAAWMTWPAGAAIFSRAGTTSLVLLVLGAEVLVTGLIGRSPMYALFDISTKKRVGA